MLLTFASNESLMI